jgi:hypothetical protein
MPRGDKSKYTDKQERQAEHIEEGYEDRGLGEKEAKRRAWATINKTTHGGKKPGISRKSASTTKKSTGDRTKKVKTSRKTSAKPSRKTGKTTASKKRTSKKPSPKGTKSK